MKRPSTIERSFEIAANGPARTMEDIKRQLRRERFEGVEVHLGGPSIRKQLLAIVAKRLS